MSKQRRESALAVVQRLNASPVRLLPPILHNATDGGLRQSDVLVVGGVPGTGKTTWAYRVAAQHLSCGGIVTFVFVPGSGNFQMRRFMEYLEMFVVTPDPCALLPLCISSVSVAGDSVMEARRKALLGALDRLEVVHCVDINDFFVYCNHGAVGASSGVGSREVAVPLFIVEGCGGKGSYLYHLERAIGHAVPLSHWLIGCLQRRRRCALIIIEEWGSEGVAMATRRRSTREESFSPFVLAVEEESEFLRYLHKETPQKKAAFRHHFAKRQRAGSTMTMTASNAGSGCTASTQVPLSSDLMVRDLHSHFAGSLRFFYLYTQMVSVATSGLSPMATLLQWRLTEQNAGGGNNEHTEMPTESNRQERWPPPPPTERTACLRGEVLCVAQL
ncbi:hypothetical protein TcG_05610 [Trypanosoma cruzi]|uniref:Uncharacterized protein n=2 Tax=Trypanosoma cruzi TaxID=5693 RepID=V5B5W7_TRYCR|nr:hypothetical protein TCDM_02528 [Trypanosoma cruzi Dm28c]KAF8280647.1 hypothetical protein TcBrA4_0093400 [Trypanosoma cruzi]PBJ71099.1 hypothetical protein BCY84_17433 [Trypanosoma cruzi cruzi]PWU88318.1 hypothetical protein C4B63_76g50 [Trypanosoma cruzi]RNF17978.1 hypothetical protein TcG_05610 [Trypanosoma cruzi]